jgi:hypothetical protein
MLSTDLTSAQRFWKAALSSTSPKPFPQLNPTPSLSDISITSTIYTPLTSIEALSKKLNCTPQAIFQTAWASTLSTYLGSNVTFGIVVSGRSLPVDDIESVIGPTFNTIPYGVDAEKDSWKELVEHAMRFNSEVVGYQHTPLRLVKKWVGKGELFDTLFVYQKDVTDDAGEKEKLWEILDGPVVADVSAVVSS